MVRQRVRIRFAKQGDLRFVGHRDLMRSVERLFRRARLPLRFSEGFHPKPRMTFPWPLALGLAGIDEVAEVELCETANADELRARLTAEAPPGLEIRDVEVLPEGAAKAKVRWVRYEVPVPEASRPQLPARIERLLAADSFPVVRPKRGRTVDLRPLLEQLAFDGETLRMRLELDPAGCVSPRDVAAALGLADLEHEGAHFTRTAMEIE
jgi:radical SAM-linked protein